MASEKVAGALSEFGIEVEPSELQHYGIKGMKWGKTSTETELQRLRIAAGIKTPGLDPLSRAAEDAAISTAKAFPKEFLNQSKNSSAQQWGLIITAGSNFVRNLFDRKETVVTVGNIKIEKTRQGAINALIEKALKQK